MLIGIILGILIRILVGIYKIKFLKELQLKTESLYFQTNSSLFALLNSTVYWFIMHTPKLNIPLPKLL